MLFRSLLDTLGIDMERIHFTWISAAEAKKWQQVISDITETTRRLGPYRDYRYITDFEVLYCEITSLSPGCPSHSPNEAHTD